MNDIKVIAPNDMDKLEKQIAALNYQLGQDTNDKDRITHAKAMNELIECRKSLKGYDKLTDYQRQFLNVIYKKHQSCLGAAEKDGYTPVSVKALDPGTLKVVFKNGEWLHYTNSEWY